MRAWAAPAMAVAAGAQGLVRELGLEAEGATGRCAVRAPAQSWPHEVAAAGPAAGSQPGTAAGATAAAATMRPRSPEHAAAAQGWFDVQATAKMVRDAPTVALAPGTTVAERAVAAMGTLSAQRTQAKAVPATRQTMADQHIQQATYSSRPCG